MKLPDTERVAALLYEAEGDASRPYEAENSKLPPFDQLPTATQQTYRDIVVAVYKAIFAAAGAPPKES